MKQEVNSLKKNIKIILFLCSLSCIIMVVMYGIGSVKKDIPYEPNSEIQTISSLQQRERISEKIEQYLDADFCTITYKDDLILVEIEFDTLTNISDEDKEKITKFIQNSMSVEEKMIEVQVV